MNTIIRKEAILLGEFLQNHCGIRGTMEELGAYQDRNYLGTCLSGEKYILKITVDADNREFIRSQNRILIALFLSTVVTSVPCRSRVS